MNTITYNKLVRDRIPEIIEENGDSCRSKILSDAEYTEALNAKLDEEVAEFHKDQNAEELADIMEILYALAKTIGSNKEELEQIRAKKAEKRGAFEQKIFLIETTKH